jgi:diguanylate cyclase (GGDEF)-like protein
LNNVVLNNDKSSVIKGVFFDEYFNNQLNALDLRNDQNSRFNKLFLDLINNILNPNIAFTRKHYKDISHFILDNDVPSIALLNFLNFFKTQLFKTFLNEDNSVENILNTCSFFDKLEEGIASIHLEHYLNNLISRNKVRIASLEEVVDQEILFHFSNHIKWMNKIANNIKHKTFNYPELNPELCLFGRWFLVNGKKMISNNNKYKRINQIHKELHIIARHIQKLMQADKVKEIVILNYMEKAELVSLEIGTELSILNNKELIFKSSKDNLTGLLNRNFLNNAFNNQFDASLTHGDKFILAIADLDNFKNINDTYGHIAGDIVLKSFAKIVYKHTRKIDTAIRYGGEEFVFIFPSTEKDEGLKILEKIRKSFSLKKSVFEKHRIKTSVSMGAIEVSPKNNLNNKIVDYYIDLADKKLYEAKKIGKNKIIF